MKEQIKSKLLQDLIEKLSMMDDPLMDEADKKEDAMDPKDAYGKEEEDSEEEMPSKAVKVVKIEADDGTANDVLKELLKKKKLGA